MDRSCGSCTLCCKALHVASLEKPTGVWCKHAKQGVGCTIYADRPTECVSFQCLWLQGLLAEEDRPDKIDVVFWSNDGYMEHPILGKIRLIYVSERHKGAAMANARCRYRITQFLKLGFGILIANETHTQSLYGLDKNTGKPKMLLEMPFVDGRACSKTLIDLTVRESDKAITAAKLIKVLDG